MPSAVIGIPVPAQPARWGPWSRSAHVLAASYVAAVRLAGGHAILVPATAGEAAPAVLARLDGLLLAGGRDVDPGTYGEAPDPRTGPVDAAQDSHDLSLLRWARARGLPTLGICRGMQLMAVERGGTLDQHVTGRRRRRGKGAPFVRLGVSVQPGTRLAAVAGGAGTRPRAFFHHQAVRAPLPDGLRVSATSGEVVAAVEDTDHPFYLGVQWHPEEDNDDAVLRALVSAAGTRALRRSDVGEIVPAPDLEE